MLHESARYQKRVSNGHGWDSPIPTRQQAKDVDTEL